MALGYYALIPGSGVLGVAVSYTSNATYRLVFMIALQQLLGFILRTLDDRQTSCPEEWSFPKSERFHTGTTHNLGSTLLRIF